jgi:YVTN family beta-propeller protein
MTVTPGRSAHSAFHPFSWRRFGQIGFMLVLLSGIVGAVTVQATVATRSQEVASPSAGILPNGWQVTPAGTQVTLGDLPLNAVLSPDGTHMLVTNDGQGELETANGENVQSLMVVDVQTDTVIQTLQFPSPQQLFLGLAYSRDGKHAYVASGGTNKVYIYPVNTDGTLGTPLAASVFGYPSGLAVAPNQEDVWVADNLIGSVSEIDASTGHLDWVVPVGLYPYTVAIRPDGKYIYVSDWGQGAVTVVSALLHIPIKTIPVGDHPEAMAFSPDGSRLYVTDTNGDDVAIVNTNTNTVVGHISLAPYPNAPKGTAPDGLAVSPDGATLYVANAGNNDIAVVDLTTDTVQGLIPTGWYPTAVLTDKTGATIYAISAKGFGAGPNDGPWYPDPERTSGPYQQNQYCHCAPDQYIGSMMNGLLSIIPKPDAQQLQQYTQQVDENDGFNRIHDGQIVNPIPVFGGTTPFKHVIVVVKENRTYDQVLGDVAKGNGDPALTIFGQAVTPNIHALAEQFTLLDNFYADAEISEQGHQWTDGAYSTDYVEKTWPDYYSRLNRLPDAGIAPISYPPAGYIFNDAAAHGVSFRAYGEWANAEPLNQKFWLGHYDPLFDFTFNLHESDQTRIDEWQREFNQFVKNGNLPQLEYIWLPRDHTEGTRPGYPTPAAMVADNDLAVGRLVQDVSHSPYWKNTVIFITEDDAQNGPDHVDAHRTVTLVVSAYNRTGAVDHTHYSTVSILRTVEEILGLPPLSQFDQLTLPMFTVFTNHPNFAPYQALPETVDMHAVNTAASPGAALSAQMDFNGPDRMPEDLLNRVLWEAMKGVNVPYPTGLPGESAPGRR